MGFRRCRDGEDLTATFSSVHVFGVRGLSNDAGLLVTRAGDVEGVAYKLAIAESLNTGCRAIADDDFAEDEAAWATEHKCSPPYLLVHIGPTVEHKMMGDFLKEEPASIHTYNAFIPARQELRELENRVMPRLFSSLSCVFGGVENPLRFKEIERAVAGRTSNGRVLFDFGIEFRVDAIRGRRIDSADLDALLQQSVNLATRMNDQVARFYYQAVREDDPLKRFLFFFLAIERQTHATFKFIDHGAGMSALLGTSDRIGSTLASFFGSQPERWKSLQDRFVWCGLTVWSHLSDDDVESFSIAKKIRDQIAHGEITVPPSEALSLVEKLAARLQLGP
jgi:hypothetical protein